MIVTSSNHKALLLSLFYVNGTSRERRFPLAVVPFAAQCMDKLKEGAIVTVNGSEAQMALVDGAIEFDSSEMDLLRDLLAGLTEASPSEYRFLQEITVAFNLMPRLVAVQQGEEKS